MIYNYFESLTKLISSLSILRSIERSFWFLWRVWIINCSKSTPLLSVYSIEDSEVEGVEFRNG